MGTRRRIGLITMLAVVLAVLAGLVWPTPRKEEPIYQGKPLSKWLDESGSNSWSASAPAAEAMQRLGTNAIPWLLREAAAHDSAPKALMLEALKRQPVFKFHFVTASDHELRARRGFTALGAAGIIAVAQGLTNSDKWIRHGCVGQWEVGKMYPDIYVPPLLGRLHDEEAMVRARAANALGMVRKNPEKVVPALVKTLDDPDEWVRCMAALGLSCYGGEAAAALPALTQHLSNCSPDFQYFATNALKAIGPAIATQAVAK